MENWTEIVAISAEFAHTLGLRRDGTVAVAGAYDGMYDVENWSDIMLPK